MANAMPHEYSFANKSWVEMYEEEHPEETRTVTIVNFGNKDDSDNKKTSPVNTECPPSKRDERMRIKGSSYVPKVDLGDTLDLFVDEDTAMGMSSPAKSISTPPKLMHSYANVLKNESPENGANSSCRDSVGQEGHNRKVVKREIQKDFLQEDLSLTSHLDVFHMQSPCKGKDDRNVAADITNGKIETSFPKINEWPLTASAKKNKPQETRYSNDSQASGEGRTLRSSKRRISLKPVDWKQLTDQPDQIPDDVLMPSPSKQIRSTDANTECASRNYVESRKRHRENYSSPSNRSKGNFLSPSNKFRDSFSSPVSKRGSIYSPSNKQRDSLDKGSANSSPSTRRKDSFSSPSNRSQSEVELETDAAVLSRRQKQIEYGKNTVGYERYTAQVPRDKREKKHPKTPPRNLKFSRRAWDGLIKSWRMRLHYWDPVSEGGGNPELLEDLNESLLSDYSANDSFSVSNSVPSTPQQESKRRKEKSSEDTAFDYELNNDFYVNDSKCEEEEEDCKPLDE